MYLQHFTSSKQSRLHEKSRHSGGYKIHQPRQSTISEWEDWFPNKNLEKNLLHPFFYCLPLSGLKPRFSASCNISLFVDTMLPY